MRPPLRGRRQRERQAVCLAAGLRQPPSEGGAGATASINFTFFVLRFKVSRGIEPLKKVLTVPRINHSAMTPLFLYGRRDSNTLYVSLPKGATGQFVIYRPMKRKALAAGLRQPPLEAGVRARQADKAPPSGRGRGSGGGRGASLSKVLFLLTYKG